MPAQLATLADRLFDRLIHAAERDIPDELEMRRLERDARGLLKSDPHAAYQILGGVAALDWDFDGLRTNHEAALRCATKASTYANYATSLQLVGFYADASKFMQEGSKRQPENLTYLRSAISYTLWAGQIKRALELQEELQKRDPERGTDRLELIQQTVAFLDHRAVDESVLEGALAIPFEILRQKRIRYSHVSLLVDDDQDALFFTVMMDRPVKVVMELDSELAEMTASRMPDLNPVIVVQYEPEPKLPPRANAGSAARVS